MNQYLETLLLFRFGPVWDGNLPSKTIRDHFVQCEYLERGAGGFQWLTAKGVKVLVDLGYLNQDTWRKRGA